MDRILVALGVNPTDAPVYVAAAMVFLAVILIAMGIASYSASRRALRARAAGTSSKNKDAGSKEKGSAESIRYLDEVTNVAPVLQPIARQLVPFNVAELSTLRQKLVRAGYLRPAAVGGYYVARLLCAVAAAGVFVIMAPYLSSKLSTVWLMVAGLGTVAAGLYSPNLWVSMRRDSLQQQYRDGFPDSLDLLVICVEAGLGLDAAINRVANELRHAHPALADNFELMALELRAGSTREEAFKNLSERMGIDEVRAMVTLLLQSEELGTSVAEALRVYSDEMRVHRMLRAEAKAQSLPVKLALPLGFFVFPCMIVVVMVPVMIRIFRVLLTT
jgi:tight adherence protein C